MIHERWETLMRQKFLVVVSACACIVSGCQMGTENQVDRKLQDVNVVAESELSDVMLTVADPNEAVTYFRRSVNQNPNNLEFRRGLALSLVRAGLNAEGVAAWANVIQHPDATNDDRVRYAEALIRDSQWEKAKAALDSVPPTLETYDRYRLEAMVADSQKEWKRADSFYEIATGLTVNPASVLNNWGYSKLTRGDYQGAEKLFMQSLTHDKTRFTVKNNLVLSRAARGIYTLPVVEMTQIERAELLYTMGLSATKRGDVKTAKALFSDALETHPQYFEAAQRSLDALENT